MAKSLKQLNAPEAVRSKIGELNDRLIDAQAQALLAQEERAALVERVGALEAELARLKEWGRDKENYELQEVYAGAFAYALKKDAGAGAPAHWLCPSGYQKGVKSILQEQARAPDRKDLCLYTCPNCKTAIRVSYKVNPREPWSGTF